MAVHNRSSLKPRRTPRQARAEVTIDAIFEATIQLLVSDGIRGLTTTRVAERAGVSVGTMYQYFPHKESLVYALNERYLAMLADRIEVTCSSKTGAPVNSMIEALITSYWQAKTERTEVTKALYRSVAELDNQPLIDTFIIRINASTIAMLESADDIKFEDVDSVNLTLLTVIFGTVRNVFEQDLSPARSSNVFRQLLIMCNAYLETFRIAESKCITKSDI